MSLATRCSACGTVFRIVQDQLRVSEGWVRCGRCNEVFNGLEGLFDLERDPVPPPWMPPSTTPDDEPVLTHDPALVDRIDEEVFGTRRHSEVPRPAPAESSLSEPAEHPKPLDEPALAEPAARPDLRADPAPEFVRRADAQARWQRSPMRLLLALLALALLVGLAGQAIHHQRNLIAARWPEARPALAAWCATAGCRLEAPRRIEDISVENTALAKAAGTEAYRLSVGLHNRATTPAALPWVDLSLTDASGVLLARRALGPQDFQGSPAELAAGAEAALQALLTTGSAPVAGYTVEIFYP